MQHYIYTFAFGPREQSCVMLHFDVLVPDPRASWRVVRDTTSRRREGVRTQHARETRLATRRRRQDDQPRVYEQRQVLVPLERPASRLRLRSHQTELEFHVASKGLSTMCRLFLPRLGTLTWGVVHNCQFDQKHTNRTLWGGFLPKINIYFANTRTAV